MPNYPPIHWLKCENGLWEERRNLPEASLLVDTLKDILAKNEADGLSKSIGIITFNDTQKVAILDEIDRKRKIDSKFDELYNMAENPLSKNLDDKPFVKNIENVQGDERDIIIFSVGYARDPDGNLRVNFGSLNRQGGENRLNVAVTRARQEIILISSVDPEELKVDTAKNMGPKRLKDYLEYAKYVSECRNEEVKNVLENLNEGFLRNEYTETRTTADTLIFESTLEELICDSLTAQGYKVVTQVGYSGYRIDLAVVHPDDPSRYILGIECDGAMFHSARSTRERDVTRQEFLENRGWIIERIWSTNWWKDPSERDRENKTENRRIKVTTYRKDIEGVDRC